MKRKTQLVVISVLLLIVGIYFNTSGVSAASSVNRVNLYDVSGTRIWSDSHSKWSSEYIRVDMPADGLSLVAVNDDPGDWPGCILCYWNHLKDGTSGWSSADGDPVWEFDPLGGPGDTDFYSVAISGNGDYITTGPSFGSYVFSHTSNVPLQTFTMGTGQSYDLTFDGKFGACGNRQGEVWCYSKDSSTPLWNYSVGGIVHSVAIQSVTSATDLIVAAGSSNGYLYVFDETGGPPLWSYDANAVSGNTGGVVSVAMSDQGQYIAVGSYHNKLYLFNSAGTKLWEKPVPVSISYGGGWMGTESRSVAISADGQYIVAGGTDKLYLYNNAGTLIWSHNGKETCVAISPNGNYIAACNYGNAVSLFSRTSSTPLWTKAIEPMWVAVSNPGYVAVSAALSAPPPGVGGIKFPVDKFGLLAPYIGLASAIVVATAAATIYVKRVRRRSEKR